MVRRRHCSRQQLVVHNSLAFCEQQILRIAQEDNERCFFGKQ